MISTAVGPRKLIRWQTLNVALLITGYSGYYLCRSNLSVSLPPAKTQASLPKPSHSIWSSLIDMVGVN